MAPLSVHIKHAGKTYDVQLHTDQPPTVFKDAIYQVTGVPPDRMKVMVKGGLLKDDHDWKKVSPKEGQTFMVIGAAGELPKPPEKPIVFLEGMRVRYCSRVKDSYRTFLLDRHGRFRASTSGEDSEFLTHDLHMLHLFRVGVRNQNIDVLTEDCVYRSLTQLVSLTWETHAT